MSTTQTVLSVDHLKGPYMGPSPYHCFRVIVNVKGVYATGSKPNFDLLAALKSQHNGITQVDVLTGCVLSFGDYNDGTNVYTVPNSEISLSSTGTSSNNVVTFAMDSGAVNGADGSELSTPTLNGAVGFLVLATLTEGAVGAI